MYLKSNFRVNLERAVDAYLVSGKCHTLYASQGYLTLYNIVTGSQLQDTCRALQNVGRYMKELHWKKIKPRYLGGRTIAYIRTEEKIEQIRADVRKSSS